MPIKDFGGFGVAARFEAYMGVVSRIFRTFHQATAPPVEVCSA